MRLVANVILTEVRRFAGHSKWMNIKHTKTEKDSKRSLLFVKLCHKMKVAIVENNNIRDPAVNLRLAQCIEDAKKASMPTATIDSFIKSMEKKTGKKFTYGLKGPGRVIMLVHAITDNVVKTKYNINSIIKKFGTVHMDGAQNIFDNIGIVKANRKLNDDGTPVVNNDTVTEHAIMAGASDIHFDAAPDASNIASAPIEFHCEPKMLAQVVQALENFNCYTIDDSYDTFVPRTFCPPLTDEDRTKIDNLYARLYKDIDDIVEIHDNQVPLPSPSSDDTDDTDSNEGVNDHNNVMKTAAADSK